MLYNQSWEILTSPNNVLIKKISFALLQQCTAILHEADTTPNHAARLAWAQQFMGPNVNPNLLVTLPSFAAGALTTVLQNADVAYAIQVSEEAVANLGNAVIDAAIAPLVPAAA